ncbi:AMP-dependent synthetase/ligase [Botryosphaeria dothidea]|uniref:AMP-dependent synthetase/ligase n=1 Tax=Botryosphaeria dothidea TaxID=55169 RepID=A0A8H4J3L4_9PEZI|nr:AMP-dependent synthetase/ligase [Botryosphaeria dothidea]KAF4312104.1 AMP-dependent synthetase/ligase [Botryosphaeria dothidea]
MPTPSPYPSIDVPNIDIWAFLFERKDKPYPDDKVIYLDANTDRSYTYAQVKNTAIDFGKGLKGVWDWQKGDVLAIFSPNCIDTPAITWGTHWAGGIISPANPTYSVEELAFQLKNAEAKAVVTQLPLLPTVQKAAAAAGVPQDRIIVMGDARDPAGAVKHFTSIRNISGVSRFRRTKLDPAQDLAFLVYSSGTTGLPKGVMLTHTNIVANTLMNRALEGVNLQSEKDKVIAFLPFFHIYGLTCLVHHGMFTGVQLVVMDKFDLEKFCSHVQEHRITFAYLVPPVVLMLSKSPVVDKYDLSSLRMTNSGAAPLTYEIVEELWKKRRLAVKQGYGLSETSPTTHTQEWADWDRKIGSVGKLMPNQVAKYMSPEEQEVPVDETGELWIKGPNVFKGYWKNDEATRNALTEDGFFKTGDVGHQDAEGHFYITDRVKELIKYKGFQVPPAELEGLLVSHPSIEDVAVVGIYDKDQATEVPRAYVVPAKGVEAGPKTEKEIIDWLTEKVAHHKRLRGGVRFVDEIPKSVSGKILRRVLKAQAVEEEKSGKAKL